MVNWTNFCLQEDDRKFATLSGLPNVNVSKNISLQVKVEGKSLGKGLDFSTIFVGLLVGGMFIMDSKEGTQHGEVDN